jgi:bifunctional DNase/RNase
VTVNGARKVFDSRSSDAIALAIHFKAPIFVEKELFDQADPEKNDSKNAQLL